MIQAVCSPRRFLAVVLKELSADTAPASLLLEQTYIREMPVRRVSTEELRQTIVTQAAHS